MNCDCRQSPVYEDGTDGRQDDAFGTEHRGDIADFYEECRKGERSPGYDKVLDRQRNEAKLKELERDLLPDEPEEDESEEYSHDNEEFGWSEDKESEETPAPDFDDLKKVFTDMEDENPGLMRVLGWILMFLLVAFMAGG